MKVAFTKWLVLTKYDIFITKNTKKKRNIKNDIYKSVLLKIFIPMLLFFAI